MCVLCNVMQCYVMLPGSSKIAAILLCHIHTCCPRAPLINVVDQCNPVSETKRLFFEKPSKQSDAIMNIELQG